MRKLITISAALILGASLVCAQESGTYNPAGRWYVSVQGGPMYQSNENSFVYRNVGLAGKLITYDAAVSVGYNFNETFGLRASVGYGLNRGACNSEDTAVKGLYPYDFKSITGFVDFVLDFNGLNAVERAFSPKLYAGIGMGHTFDFTKPEGYGHQRTVAWQAEEKFHPWQHVYEVNNVLAYRLGGILEYNFAGGFGIFLDACLEAYNDSFNGLRPYEEDHAGTGYTGKGYAGFPLDLRVPVNLGVLYRF